MMDVDALEDRLSEPTPEVVAMMQRLPGDIVFLGAGGKMGPTMARMARRAADQARTPRRIIAVSRFNDREAEARLQAHGVETIRFDLLDFDHFHRLPDAPNIIHMTGMKFGSSGQQGLTWAMNVLLPARAVERYRGSRFVAFSTGNVYGLTPVLHGGSLESDALHPVGEYAMSTVGRERALEYTAKRLHTPLALIRLNYACELRYGVLVDIARKVFEGQAVDVTMGHLNAIWQGDANAMSLCCLEHVSDPPFIINVAGAELLSVRQVALTFGHLMGMPVTITGHEASEAFLSNSQRAVGLFGYPRVGVRRLMEWIVDWVRRGGASLGKPTHFKNRAGEY